MKVCGHYILSQNRFTRGPVGVLLRKKGVRTGMLVSVSLGRVS